MSNEIEAIDRRIRELGQNQAPGEAFDWDDVEYLRLLARKLELGVALNFNPRWFGQMADKLAATLRGTVQVPLLTIAEAREQEVCRVCREKDSPRRLPDIVDAFVYNYGHEYAHESCLELIGKRRVAGRGWV